MSLFTPASEEWKDYVEATIAALVKKQHAQADSARALYEDMKDMKDPELLVLQASPVPCADLNCRGLDEEVPVTLARLILQGHQQARSDASNLVAIAISVLALIASSITPALKIIEMAINRRAKPTASSESV